MLFDTLDLSTASRAEMVNLTARLADWVNSHGAREGILTVYCPHTTAGITVNEGYDPDVCTDMLQTLERLAPRDPRYRHAEGNSDSHVKATLVGSSARVFVRAGRLGLGRWQAVYFCEFDGPRSRQVELAFDGEAR